MLRCRCLVSRLVTFCSKSPPKVFIPNLLMYIKRFFEPFLLCSLALRADSAPVNPNSIIQPRIPYSVVAVDGGVTAISSQVPLPTKTITKTVARTKTAEETKTLTGPASTDPVSTVTLTTSHTSTTKVVVTANPSTVTACNSNLPVIPPGTTKSADTVDFVPETLSLAPQQSTSRGDASFTESPSSIHSVGSSCMNMTSGSYPTPTANTIYGVPPSPSNQPHVSSPPYPAWRCWNTTSTDQHSPTGTSSADTLEAY